MSLYMKLSQKPQQFRTLTGAEQQRQPDGDAQYANPLPDRCLLLLLYYRLYVSHAFLTLLFKAASQSLICRGIQSVRLLWEAVLPLPEGVR